MFKNLIPWHRKSNTQSRRNELATGTGGDLESRWDDFGNLLNRLYGDSPLWGDNWDIGYGCDVEDTEKEFIVRAEAPGFEPKEIDVQMSGNRLVLRAEHKEEKKEKNGRSTRYGRFHRTMTLPNGIEAEKIRADYKNGVLEIHLPKGKDAQSKRIPVKPK